jgi:hypothetical protein
VGGKAELHFDHSNLSAEKDAPERYRHEHNARITGQVTRSRTAARAELHLGLGAREEEVSFALEPHGNEVLLTVTHRRLGDRAASGPPMRRSSANTRHASEKRMSSMVFARVAALQSAATPCPANYSDKRP